MQHFTLAYATLGYFIILQTLRHIQRGSLNFSCSLSFGERRLVVPVAYRCSARTPPTAFPDFCGTIATTAGSWPVTLVS